MFVLINHGTIIIDINHILAAVDLEEFNRDHAHDEMVEEGYKSIIFVDFSEAPIYCYETTEEIFKVIKEVK